MSKAAEEYFEKEWANNRVYYVGKQLTETLNKITIEEAIEESFDAGVASVPSDTELVDENQALKEELERIKEEHKVQESAEIHQLKEKLEWHKCEPFNYPKVEHDVLIKENITVNGKDIDIITVARIDGCADYWYSYNPENGKVIYHYPYEWREIE